MTGMTTTPHLHIQVDTEDAPFYPYWPFTNSQASAAGLDMYSAVDAGLNQDLILKYSVDPLDFIKKATTIDGPSVAADRTEAVAPIAPVIKNTVTPTTTTVKAETTPTVQSQTSGTFHDVSTSNPHYASITYFTQK